MQSDINKVCVLGAGVLGGQIAWHSAFKGKEVTVYDIHEDGLSACQRAHSQYAHIYKQDLSASDGDLQRTKDRLRFSTVLAEAVADADLVIEAVPEVPEIKTDVYEKMSALLPAKTLIATNSSTLLPASFAEATGRPSQYCAMHYANLVWSLNLIEIMAHAATAADTLARCTAFAIETGMVPIPVRKEQNGYLLNSWFVPLVNAAQSLVTNGVGTPEDVDRTFMITNRGCSLGPMGFIDVVGMKTVYDVLHYWGEVNNDAQMKANADFIKTQMMDRGRMGLQSGQGYYRYPDPAYSAPEFLNVPSLDQVAEIVRLTQPSS